MSKIAIVGAGMGGLALAAAMRHSKHEVVVYEQARELAELGAGISLWANGTRLFDEMGITEWMKDHSCETETALFRDEDGSIAASQLLSHQGWYRNEYGYPYYGALRTDLQSGLLKSIRSDSIHLGKQLVSLDDTGEMATLHWADGTSDTADVVIGADGIRSIVRNTIDDSAQAVFTGNSAFRGLAKTADLTLLPEPYSFTDWMGDGQHLLNFPVGKNFEYTTIVVFMDGPEKWEHDVWRVPSDPAEIYERFSGWHPAIKQMLDHVILSERWGLFQVSRMQTWHKGRVVILGDAAHGMMPHHGQGAISSFEDAITLAHILDNENISSLEEKFARYEQERKARGEKIQLESRMANDCLHLPKGKAREDRNKILNNLPKHFEWLHSYKCPD